MGYRFGWIVQKANKLLLIFEGDLDAYDSVSDKLYPGTGNLSDPTLITVVDFTIQDNLAGSIPCVIAEKHVRCSLELDPDQTALLFVQRLGSSAGVVATIHWRIAGTTESTRAAAVRITLAQPVENGCVGPTDGNTLRNNCLVPVLIRSPLAPSADMELAPGTPVTQALVQERPGAIVFPKVGDLSGISALFELTAEQSLIQTVTITHGLSHHRNDIGDLTHVNLTIVVHSEDLHITNQPPFTVTLGPLPGAGKTISAIRAPGGPIEFNGVAFYTEGSVQVKGNTTDIIIVVKDDNVVTNTSPR
jgi:hypothetical protein